MLISLLHLISDGIIDSFPRKSLSLYYIVSLLYHPDCNVNLNGILLFICEKGPDFLSLHSCLSFNANTYIDEKFFSKQKKNIILNVMYIKKAQQEKSI